MKLLKAERCELQEITALYREIIAKTTAMEQYARWQWKLHPTEEMLKKYIENGAMYVLRDAEKPAGAMAVTERQGEDYHDIGWGVSAADDAVAVIHLLGIAPEYQGRGIGKQMIDAAIRLARRSGKKALRLDALASNTPAQRLYLSKGFAYCGKKNLYASNTGWTDFYFYEYGLELNPPDGCKKEDVTP